MIHELKSDYVRTAIAKGLSQRAVVYRHALKNLLSPVITLAGLQFSAVISGAVLVETVFSWPGLGTLAFQSIIARDTPTILGILFFSTLVVVVGNLLTELALRLVNPRIKGTTWPHFRQTQIRPHNRPKTKLTAKPVTPPPRPGGGFARTMRQWRPW